MTPRVFLLSPAETSGPKARMLTGAGARSELAMRLRKGGAPIAEVFQFVSSLYFRGKLAYSEAFACAPAGCASRYVIAPGLGLVAPETVVALEHVLAMAQVPVDARESRFREPLARDSVRLRDAIGPGCGIVLLGSVASGKYTEPLLEVFGKRLLFPVDFVGRGNMSRGGLMLRAAREANELAYVPLAGAVLRGKRPPRLPKLPRRSDIVKTCD